MRFLFAPRFNRADFYGFGIFVAALWSGVPPWIALPIFMAWAAFSAFMEKGLDLRRG